MEGLLDGVVQDLNEMTENIVAIDCMGFVHQLRIHDGINTLSDLADEFVKLMKHEWQRFETIVLVFDHYDTLKPSLKQQTWDDRSKSVQVQYNLMPKTIIKNIKLKQLLSHPINKQRMCDIFAKRAIEMLQTRKNSW